MVRPTPRVQRQLKACCRGKRSGRARYRARAAASVTRYAGRCRLIAGHRDEAVANRRVGGCRVRDLQRCAVGQVRSRLDAQPAACILAIGRVQHRRDQRAADLRGAVRNELRHRIPQQAARAGHEQRCLAFRPPRRGRIALVERNLTERPRRRRRRSARRTCRPASAPSAPARNTRPRAVAAERRRAEARMHRPDRRDASAPPALRPRTSRAAGSVTGQHDESLRATQIDERPSHRQRLRTSPSLRSGPHNRCAAPATAPSRSTSANSRVVSIARDVDARAHRRCSRRTGARACLPRTALAMLPDAPTTHSPLDVDTSRDALRDCVRSGVNLRLVVCTP